MYVALCISWDGGVLHPRHVTTVTRCSLSPSGLGQVGRHSGWVVTDFVTGPLNHHGWVISKKMLTYMQRLDREISKVSSTVFENVAFMYSMYMWRAQNMHGLGACFLCTFVLMSLQAFHVGFTLTACFLRAAGNPILCLSFA